MGLLNNATPGQYSIVNMSGVRNANSLLHLMQLTRGNTHVTILRGTTVTKEKEVKKVSNKRIADAFRRAVPYLSTGPLSYHYSGRKNEFICYAIAEASSPDAEGANAARQIIRNRLGNVFTLEHWLRIKGIETQPCSKPMQKHRHAWLKMLINEFESKK